MALISNVDVYPKGVWPVYRRSKKIPVGSECLHTQQHEHKTGTDQLTSAPMLTNKLVKHILFLYAHKLSKYAKVTEHLCWSGCLCSTVDDLLPNKLKIFHFSVSELCINSYIFHNALQYWKIWTMVLEILLYNKNETFSGWEIPGAQFLVGQTASIGGSADELTD